MLNLNDLINVLKNRDEYTFFVSDSSNMFANEKLRDSVLKLSYTDIRGILKEISRPFASNIPINSIEFETDNNGGSYTLYLVIVDENFKELYQLQEHRNIKMAQLSNEIAVLQSKLKALKGE